MTEKNSEMVRLDAYQTDNWTSSEVPVAILNTESTLHHRIAYCWGLANQLRILSDFLTQHEDPEIQQVTALFGCQLMPLETMLKKMGYDTQPGEGSKPKAVKPLTRASEP